MNRKQHYVWLATMIAVSASLPTSAAAYIGPGAGFGAIAVTLALVLGGLLLLVGLVWYPLKRMFKGKKVAQEQDTTSE